MSTVRVTAGEAVVKFLAAQRVETPAGRVPLFGGVFAIFGHGIVAGLGEALYRYRQALPTLRAHNEQAMAHTAIAYAKAHLRRRMMAVTTSVGPGATNLVTAAATAHVNRLPVLLLPADVFASRAPDPVLQQVEGFADGTASANDCFRPVSRYFDRITRPEQLITALPRALRVLTDPAECGPVTLALCQDVEAMAFDYPEELFEERTAHFRAPPPDEGELARAVEVLKGARRPLIVAGGGVIYGQASEPLRAFADAFGVPVAETLAGKGALAWDHPLQAGGIGHTGVPAANELAPQADVVLSGGHAARRLHHRLAHALPPGPGGRAQRGRVRRGQVVVHAAAGRRAAGAGGPARSAGGLEGRAGLDRSGAPAVRRAGRSGC